MTTALPQSIDRTRLPEGNDSPFFLRLTAHPDNTEYYPTAGDLVLQLLLPKFDPASSDLTSMGSVPVVVIFSNRGECISLPMWENATQPQQVAFIPLDPLIEYTGNAPRQASLPTRVPGNHWYVLLKPVYASAKRGIEWLFPKYIDLPDCPWLWPAEPFSRFSVSPNRLRWLEWKVYYLLFPNLGPITPFPSFGPFYRGKLGWREHKNIHKVMEMVHQLTILWSAMDEQECNAWNDERARLLGENAGKRINPPIRGFDGRGYLEVLPDWRDVVLLALPSGTTGLIVGRSDRNELQKVMNCFEQCIDLHNVVADPALLKEAEKFLLRVPPQDEISGRISTVPRSWYHIDAGGSVFLLPTKG